MCLHPSVPLQPTHPELVWQSGQLELLLLCLIGVLGQKVLVARTCDQQLQERIALVTSTAEGKSFGVVKQLLQVIWRFLSSFAEIKAAVLVHKSASI